MVRIPRLEQPTTFDPIPRLLPPMRTFQPQSKLMLLNDQRLSRPSPWPKLVLVLVLGAIVVWNIGVIRDRYGYGEGGEETAGKEAEAEESTPPEEEAVGRASGASSAPDAAAASSLAASQPLVDSPTDAKHFSETTSAALVSAPAGAAHPPSVSPPDESPSASSNATSNGDSPSILLPGAPIGNGHALESRVIASTIRPGQAVATAIMNAGLTGDQAHRVVTALTGIFDFRSARPGDGFRIKLSPEGRLDLFDYESSPTESYVVRRKNGSLVGFKRDLQEERELLRIEGEIHSSLFGAVDSAGADASLAVLLANVLAWDVDFYRDPRRGDRFRVVVERYHHRGRHLRYGNILAAEYEGDVGHVRLFRHERPNGETAYYDEEGQSAQRAFLRAPLQIVRITSGYGNRTHPILGYSRKHRGVDYGAPTGTPVWAVGDGRVIRAGRHGGYGNLVVLRHANGYTTWYAHLSRMHVRVGERVSQQQVIGRVGATGMATGPHLHYEIRHHGRHINPLTLELPPRDPLPESELPAFHASIEPARALLDDVTLVAQAPGALPPL